MTTVERKLQRDNLCRAVPFTIASDGDTVGDGLTFRGYGAVFNSPTRIDSYEGLFDEQIAPGAFRKSLRERTPKFQFDHGNHPMIGSIPIGAITDIQEDERGLFVEARLGKHLLIDLVREAIATGAIDGMSFRFSVVREEWTDADGKTVAPGDVEQAIFGNSMKHRGPLLRTLKEVKIVEVGPVVWPAYADTAASVRSEVIQLDMARINDPEQRKLLARAVLLAESAAGAPDEGAVSDDEPQDTDEESAVEHSGEDADSPRDTDEESAVEHELESETENSESPESGRAEDVDDVFENALAEIRSLRSATPPMRGL